MAENKEINNDETNMKNKKTDVIEGCKGCYKPWMGGCKLPIDNLEEVNCQYTGI